MPAWYNRRNQSYALQGLFFTQANNLQLIHQINEPKQNKLNCKLFISISQKPTVKIQKTGTLVQPVIQREEQKEEEKQILSIIIVVTQ